MVAMVLLRVVTHDFGKKLRGETVYLPEHEAVIFERKGLARRVTPHSTVTSSSQTDLVERIRFGIEREIAKPTTVFTVKQTVEPDEKPKKAPRKRTPRKPRK